MKLFYFIDSLLFEDNHNIVRDRFERDSGNVIQNRLPVAKKNKEISMYINLAQSHQ